MTLQTICRSSLWFVLLSFLVACFTGLSVFANSDTPKRSFDIPSGRAIDTLKEAAKQAEVDFIFSADLLRGVKTPSVKGTYTPFEAFRFMLANTSLAVFQHEQSGIYAVRSISSKPSTPNNGRESIEETDMKLKKKNWLKSFVSMFAIGIAAGSNGQDIDDNSVTTLDPFEVAGTSTGYTATNTISGTAMNTPLRDVPMTINVITSELVEDMAPLDLQDVMKINSSMTQTNRHPVVNRTASWSIRGFLNRNVLVNGVKSGDLVLPQLIDRVEVVKGPNTLYGQSDPGGLVNIITKRPKAVESSVVKTTVGDNGRFGLDLDVNTLAADDAVKLRVLAGYEESDGYRVADGDRTRYAGLVGSIKASERTTFNIDAMGDETSGIPGQRAVYPFVRIPTDLNGDGVIDDTIVQGVTESTARYNSSDVPIEYTSASPASRFANDRWNLGLGVRHSFSDNVTANYQYVNTDQYQSMNFSSINTFQPTDELGGELGASPNFFYQHNLDQTEAHTLQTAIVLDDSDVTHRFLIGARSTEDYLEQQLKFMRSGNADERAILDEWIADGRDLTLLLRYEDILNGTSTHNDDELPTAAEIIAFGAPLVDQFAKTDVESFYITDSIGLMDDQLKILAGLRYTDITTSNLDSTGALVGVANDRSDTSYQLGIGYDLNNYLTLFGNVATAFNPNGLNAQTGDFFEPEESTAKEIGLKFEGLWDNRVTGSIALFEIDKENVVRSDFDPDTFGQLVDITDDQSKGVDVDLTINFTDSWQTLVGYSYLDAEVVAGQSTAVGLNLEGAAPHKFTLWTSYGFDNGFRFGGGLIHAEGRIQQYGNSVNRLIYEDGYTEVNLFARYETTVGEYPLSFGLNVSNVTDTLYLQSRGGTNNPRQITFSSRVEF